MADGQFSLEELGDRVGLTRRSIRFYVQRGLLPPPLGLGRGKHYDQRHLDALRRVGELQSAGHSLDAIGKILAGGEVPAGGAVAMESAAERAPADAGVPPARRRAELSAELWTRLRLAPGVELHFDTGRAHPTVEQLLQIRQAVRRILRPDLLEDEEIDDAED
jgi:DNA-binding transcriptional MerR regulator